MTDPKPKEYAFPRACRDEISAGLTKREYFAAMAMQGLLASPKYPEGLGHVGTDAVKFADDLIAALAK